MVGLEGDILVEDKRPLDGDGLVARLEDCVLVEFLQIDVGASACTLRGVGQGCDHQVPAGGNVVRHSQRLGEGCQAVTALLPGKKM